MTETATVSLSPETVLAEMKQNGVTPLSTIGSLSLCRSLLVAGLVDPVPGRCLPGRQRCVRREHS